MLKKIMLTAIAVTLSSVAYAAPDQAGSSDITEDNGFPGVCDQPCFTATKSYEYYQAGNATVPAGANCAGTENTYIYTITHNGGSGPFVPALTAFELDMDTAEVGAAGSIPGFGIDPSGTVVGAQTVEWKFEAPPISATMSSTKLFVCSRLTPGNITDSMISIDGQAALDAPGTCVGPVFEPPSDGEALPCTIGFWKNRSKEKKGTLKWFPDAEFDQVVTQAVALSAGLFADEAALLADLNSKGNRPADQKARQQVAAFLLNLAAGDLFPDNTKCKLFEGNQIDTNSCGDNISVGDGIDNFFALYNAGQFGDAKDCADDTNNGIGVVGSNTGE